ncbi:MAG TPA: TIGR03936 family radical SAM-associated protein [Dehalococcoidales bacterium]|nr:TIGR03936 family radical SAM-associated protein [Dehalococcoidales bacterium]
MQRLRIKFKRGEELKFISHLDIVRLWQRSFNRAGIQIAYSNGFSPHPRISLAAPLALGITSEAELMDIVIVRGVSPQFFVSAINRQLPAGLMVEKVQPIGPDLPSLQALVSQAVYRVRVDTTSGPADIHTAVAQLLALEHLPWQHQRDTGPRHYDLRPLISEITVTEWNPPAGILEMNLRCDSGGSGRPEQVTAALGFRQRPAAIHRIQLILKN